MATRPRGPHIGGGLHPSYTATGLRRFPRRRGFCRLRPTLLRAGSRDVVVRRRSLAAVGVIALVVFVIATGADRGGDSWAAPATTYSPGPGGIKALYLLFEKVGFGTERLRRSEYEHLDT